MRRLSFLFLLSAFLVVSMAFTGCSTDSAPASATQNVESDAHDGHDHGDHDGHDHDGHDHGDHDGDEQ